MLVGSIQEITRHPVKSFAGERVKKTKVMDYGLYGDRSHAFKDKQGKFITITQVPEMVRYQAFFSGEENLNAYPELKVKTPKGNLLTWGEEGFREEMALLLKREAEAVVYPPSHIPFGAIEEENILLVSDASIGELTKLWGNEADGRRFRHNLVLSLVDKIPFLEERWFGKRLVIGNDVELEIKRHCERCMIITVDPVDSHKDPSLLKTVVKERNNHFGVYASVVRTGEIRLGDPVFLTD
ncbi:MOSC N-terminal beta barrel domain-containing protein [Peribacillus sp. SI8-4]|uniref:MOSC domain-containing protein n=1 Tax=Peribacillus sp. SI8-4 TaxID=3048009 RepID=UPI00255799EA|nr:MOSC N-terminal beta barrel domain-containing protein [Peribacillus sp. SI8-4]